MRSLMLYRDGVLRLRQGVHVHDWDALGKPVEQVLGERRDRREADRQDHKVRTFDRSACIHWGCANLLTVHGVDMNDELATGAMGVGGGGHLASELVRLGRLALAS